MRLTPLVAVALALPACKPDPEQVTKTVTHTVTEPVTQTVTVPNTEPDPGRYEQTLIQLAQVFDDKGAIGSHGFLEDHMHVDEVRYRASDAKLFYCAYTFGVIDATDVADPEYLAQGYQWDLGSPVGRDTGCLHVDWDDADPDIVYVSHRGNYDFQAHLSVVDLDTDATTGELAPVLAPSLREPDVSYEGLDAENGLVYVALHQGGIGVFQRDPSTNEMSRVGGEATLVPNAYDIEVVGTTAYVVDEQDGLYILDVTDPAAITQLGHVYLGGIDRDLEVDGDYAYVAAGGAGLAIVDVSDPTNPSIASFTPTHGTAVRVGYHQDRIAVAAWNDTRVYDVSDPAAPDFIGAARLERPKTYANDPDNERPDITARTLGVDLYGDELFVGNWMTPYTFRIRAEHAAPYMVLPEDIFYMGTGSVAVGETGAYELDVENQGTAPLTLIDAWVTNPLFTVTPELPLVVQPGDEVELTLTYTPADDTEQSGILNLLTDDPAQPLRLGYVVGNPEGIGIGDPFPITEGTLVTSLDPWTSAEMSGQVALVAYFATF